MLSKSNHDVERMFISYPAGNVPFPRTCRIGAPIQVGIGFQQSTFLVYLRSKSHLLIHNTILSIHLFNDRTYPELMYTLNPE